ncbi:peptidase M15 [Myxococcota bacterium]|nr:peptidase M15 [Myxococcota bacterium]MBU1537382.1 peptidase M15 [Myxococcota bacterium]
MTLSTLVSLMFLGLFGTPGRPGPAGAHANKPPRGFSDLRRLCPTMRFHIAYHTRHNFTGAPLQGYGVPGAWLRTRAARALKKVHRELARRGLGLLIFDAYRPHRATLAMLAWAKRSGNYWQVTSGYISPTSSHNKGAAVDLSLFSLRSKKPLDMGTPFDSMSKKAHTLSVKGVPLKNRLILKRAMERHGFRNFSKEWWHYNFVPLRKARARDVPYGCFEPVEGRWKAPAGWDRPTYKAALIFHPGPCVTK